MTNDIIIAVNGKTVEGWDLDAIKQLTVRFGVCSSFSRACLTILLKFVLVVRSWLSEVQEHFHSTTSIW